MGQKLNQTIVYEVGTVDEWSKALVFERENKRESKDPRLAPGLCKKIVVCGDP